MQIGLHGRNFGLDVMRVIAISLVLVNHLIGNFINADIGVFWYLAYLGVEVFFVLSGFLIGTILVKSVDSKTGRFHFGEFRRFVQRRWFRTLPLYYLLLLINYLATYSVNNTLVELDVRFFFFLQNFSSFPPAFFGESWSLCIEEWFYILYPLGLFVLTKVFPSTSGRLVLGYTISFIVFGILLRRNAAYREFNIVSMRLDAIAYGVLLAVLNFYYFSVFFRRFAKAFGAAGITVILLAVFIFLSRKLVGGFYLLYYPLIGIGLASGLIFLKQLEAPTTNPLFLKCIQFLSKISYSLYLNNLVIIFLVKSFCPVSPILQVLIALIIILLVSAATYLGVEKYFLKLREKVVPASPAQKLPSNRKTFENAHPKA